MGETLTVLNGMNASDARHRNRSVEFGEGTVWDWDQVLAQGLRGTKQADSLTFHQSRRPTRRGR